MPASSAATTMSLCDTGIVTTLTRSSVSIVSMRSYVSYGVALTPSAAFAARALSMSHTATIATSETAEYASKCAIPCRPHPITPTRMELLLSTTGALLRLGPRPCLLNEQVCRYTTANRHDLAGDPRCIIGSEKGESSGNLRCVQKTLLWNPGKR